jgi:hypothetical protein
MNAYVSKPADLDHRISGSRVLRSFGPYMLDAGTHMARDRTPQRGLQHKLKWTQGA